MKIQKIKNNPYLTLHVISKVDGISRNDLLPLTFVVSSSFKFMYDLKALANHVSNEANSEENGDIVFRKDVSIVINEAFGLTEYSYLIVKGGVFYFSHGDGRN